MSLLDSLLGALGGGDKTQLIAGLLSQFVSGQSTAPGAPSSFAGLIQQFENAGLGNLINSWIRTGTNHEPTPEEIQQGLGPDAIQHFSEQTGLHGNEVAKIIAQILPQMIDKVTPTGAVPPQNDLQGMLSGLLGSLGK